MQDRTKAVRQRQAAKIGGNQRGSVGVTATHAANSVDLCRAVGIGLALGSVLQFVDVPAHAILGVTDFSSSNRALCPAIRGRFCWAVLLDAASLLSTVSPGPIKRIRTPWGRGYPAEVVPELSHHPIGE